MMMMELIQDVFDEMRAAAFPRPVKLIKLKWIKSLLFILEDPLW